jgi:transglutaminase-like putative cysteine protease
MFWKKLSSIFLSIFFLFLIIVTPIQAESNSDYFDTKLHTTVTVSDAGQSRVKHEFTVTNKTPTTYISQYGLKISSAQLKNITVISDGKSIKPEIVPIKSDQQSGPGQTSIGITFPGKVVGEGKIRKFTISYTNPDAAVISGSVLEVTLAPQANPQDYSDYSVTLITPARFGGPIRTTPTIHNFTASGSQIVTSFSKEEEMGVFALFGSEQLFDLDLSYSLSNSTNNPGITQVAFPPDTAFQKIHYHLIEPKPEKMELDLDGNWIATYKLPASSDTLVKLLATVRLTLEPDESVPVSIPDESLLKTQEYWPINNSDLKSITQDRTTPKEINDFVVNTLNYNTDIALGLPERLGAIGAINNPNDAVCQEFTDLFVTLARGAGIYSRRITGYAHSQNSELRPLSLVEDILHSWPDYYSPEKQRWIPIDPTWENTTGGVDYFHQLDLNHIVFAINGQNSVTPHPAGSYKKPDATEKTVNVDFGAIFPEHLSEIEFQLKPQKFLGLVNIPGLYHLEVTNLAGQADYHLPLEITASSSQISSSQNISEIVALLPFQRQIIPLRIENNTGFIPSRDTIQIKALNETQEFELTTSPAISQYLHQKSFIMAMAGGAIFISLATGSLLVLRRKR